MSSDANPQLVRRFIDEVWNAANPQAADAFLSADYVDHAYGQGGAAGLKAAIAELAASFPHYSFEIEDMAADGDKVVVRLRLTAVHTGQFRHVAPSGKAVDIRVFRWFRIQDGRIAEHWALLDTLGLLRQIGAMG